MYVYNSCIFFLCRPITLFICVHNSVIIPPIKLRNQAGLKVWPVSKTSWYFNFLNRNIYVFFFYSGWLPRHKPILTGRSGVWIEAQSQVWLERRAALGSQLIFTNGAGVFLLGVSDIIETQVYPAPNLPFLEILFTVLNFCRLLAIT